MEKIIYDYVTYKAGIAKVKNLEIITNINLEFFKHIKLLIPELLLFSGQFYSMPELNFVS